MTWFDCLIKDPYLCGSAHENLYIKFFFTSCASYTACSKIKRLHLSRVLVRRPAGTVLHRSRSLFVPRQTGDLCGHISLNHSVAAPNIVEFLSAYNKAINYTTDVWGAPWKNQNLSGLICIDLAITSMPLHLCFSFRKLVRDFVLSIHFTDEAWYLTDVLNHSSNAALSFVKVTHLPVSCSTVESCKWR
jgi:hypothetical protein